MSFCSGAFFRRWDGSEGGICKTFYGWEENRESGSFSVTLWSLVNTKQNLFYRKEHWIVSFFVLEEKGPSVVSGIIEGVGARLPASALCGDGCTLQGGSRTGSAAQVAMLLR